VVKYNRQVIVVVVSQLQAFNVVTIRRQQQWWWYDSSVRAAKPNSSFYFFNVLLTSVNNNNYSKVPIGDAKSVNLSLYFLYGNSRGRRCALGPPEASALGGNTPSP